MIGVAPALWLAAAGVWRVDRLQPIRQAAPWSVHRHRPATFGQPMIWGGPLPTDIIGRSLRMRRLPDAGRHLLLFASFAGNLDP